MRTVTDAERRARLGSRHHLASPAPAPDTAADAVVALHSTDPATVFLSTWARVQGFVRADLEDALYTDGTLVRMHAMRRTLWVTTTARSSVLDAACAQDIAAKERARIGGFLEGSGHTDDGPAWLDALAPKVLAALEARGEATTSELAEDVDELGLRMILSPGKRYEQEVAVASRVLLLMGMQGLIVRGRASGSWLSSQYRWRPAPGADEPTSETAVAELVRAWLRAFGPGRLDDIKWWTGWTVRKTRAALAAVEAVEVTLDDDGTGYLLPDDVDPVDEPEPWVALLPGLDPTTMGWKERAWYLGPHKPTLFDTNGNAGPTVWCDGRVVGGWGQRPDGEVVTKLLEDPGAEATTSIAAEADRLTSWLDGTRITPRFRTPLERELSKG